MRAPRAAVFAVLCVLLAAVGHTLASRAELPTTTFAQAWCVVFAAAYLAAGRERGIGGIAVFLLAAQGVLHAWFQAAQIEHPAARCVSVVQLPSGLDVPQLCSAAMPSWAVNGVMLAVYALVALVFAWWLRRGEAAVFALVRLVLDRGRALIDFTALLLSAPAPVGLDRPARLRPDRRDARPATADVFLPVVRRGPPAASATA